jgi:RNA polymerase sigma-70 factor, ECF subfamily
MSIPGVPETAELDFRQMFMKEYSYVYSTLRRLGVRAADLKDEAQEVFVVVHGLRHDYDASRPARPWLFAIAYRIAARHRTRHVRERLPDGELPEPVDASRGADEELEAAEARDLVLAALSQMDLPRRAVFVMSDIDDISVPDIARELGIPLNTAYSRLRLGRAEFADAVKRLRARGARGRA